MINCKWMPDAEHGGFRCVQAGCCNRSPNNTRHQNCFSWTTNCPHLEDFLGISTRIYGVGCPAEQANGIIVAVSECAMHGLCVPKHRATNAANAITEFGTEPVAICFVCPDNPANQTPTAPPNTPPQ